MQVLRISRGRKREGLDAPEVRFGSRGELAPNKREDKGAEGSAQSIGSPRKGKLGPGEVTS